MLCVNPEYVPKVLISVKGTSCCFVMDDDSLNDWTVTPSYSCLIKAFLLTTTNVVTLMCAFATSSRSDGEYVILENRPFEMLLFVMTHV